MENEKRAVRQGQRNSVEGMSENESEIRRDPVEEEYSATPIHVSGGSAYRGDLDKALDLSRINLMGISLMGMKLMGRVPGGGSGSCLRIMRGRWQLWCWSRWWGTRGSLCQTGEQSSHAETVNLTRCRAPRQWRLTERVQGVPGGPP